MHTESQGMILFVEDVREELGGKTSLMGLMGSEVEVNASEIEVYCVMLLVEGRAGSADLSGNIIVHGVPEDYKQPRPLKKTIELQKADNGSFVQVVAKLPRITIVEKDIKIEANLTVDEGYRKLNGSLVIKRANGSLSEPVQTTEKKRRLPVKKLRKAK